MSAIHTIIETYIRFADEQALVALRAHRLKLLATIDENDPFFGNLPSQCIEDISAIEAGLMRLRPPTLPLQDTGAPEASSSGPDQPPLEKTLAEPIASWDEKDAVASPPDGIAPSDQAANAAVPPPAPESPEPRPMSARTSDPSLIAGSLLVASLTTKTEGEGTGLAAELVKLQLRLAARLKG
jgi:hypothetical protein